MITQPPIPRLAAVSRAIPPITRVGKRIVLHSFVKKTMETQRRELLRSRRDAGLTQAQVAERMGTKPPAVTRLETALADSGHSPTLVTLKKYAKAVGCRLEIRLVPEKKARRAS
jgi:hypothetical protein